MDKYIIMDNKIVEHRKTIVLATTFDQWTQCTLYLNAWTENLMPRNEVGAFFSLSYISWFSLATVHAATATYWKSLLFIFQKGYFCLVRYALVIGGWANTNAVRDFTIESFSLCRFRKLRKK